MMLTSILIASVLVVIVAVACLRALLYLLVRGAVVLAAVAGLAVAASATTTATDSPPRHEPRATAARVTYPVYRTGGAHLNVRGGPGTDHRRVGRLAPGTQLSVTCWREGEPVHGSPLWLGVAGRQHGFVAAYYVDAPWHAPADVHGPAARTHPLPHCGRDAAPLAVG